MFRPGIGGQTMLATFNQSGGWNAGARRLLAGSTLKNYGRSDSGRLSWLILTSFTNFVGANEVFPNVERPDESVEDRRQRLEAVLLISREPVSTRKLGQLAGLADATEARTLSRQLNEIYDSQGRAFRIEEVAGGFQLLSRPQFAKWLRRLEYVPNQQRLTSPAMETLALVAYRQPIFRADIEMIRGVGCGEVLRQLMHRDLVRICGRSEELGRPYLYGTTKRFLQLFGIHSLKRLPRADWVRAAELELASRSTDDGSDDTNRFEFFGPQVSSEK